MNDNNNEESEPDFSAVCDRLDIQSASAKPTHSITIEGFSEEFGENAFGWMRDTNDPDKKTPIVFIPDFSEETAVFVLPVHPTNLMEGGEVELEIIQEDEDFTCSGFSLSVEALKPSPGASEQLTETFKNGLNEIISAFGYDPDEVKNKTADEVDPVLIPFVMAYHSVESTIFENNLSSILEGTAPMLEGEELTTEQKKVLDALIAESGIASYFKDYASSISKDLDSIQGSSKRSSKFKIKDDDVLDEGKSPEWISDLMTVQQYAEETVSGFSGGYLQTVAFVSSFQTAALALATVISGGTTSIVTGPAAAVTGAVATTTSVIYFVSKAISELYPSQLGYFQMKSEKTEFNEDYSNSVWWEIKLKMVGEKFSVSTTDILSFLPVGKVFGIKPIKNVINEIEQVVLETFQEIGLTIASEYDNSGVLEFPVQEYITTLDPERENEEQYFIWEIDYLSSWDGSPPVFEMCTNCTDSKKTSSKLGFTPVKEGESELRAEVKAEPFYLSGNKILTEKIIVHPISIQLSPEDTTVYLEDVDNGVNLRATVKNAENEKLSWSGEEGTVAYTDDLAHNVVYQPPAETGRYEVIAEAITEDGPRADRQPPRTGKTFVYVKDEEEGCAHFDAENAKNVKVEASGSYNNSSPASDFSISYALADADPDTETACGYSGAALEDDISLPWSFEQEMAPPFSASINIVGLQDHSNNMTLRIYVDGDVVAEYEVDGFLESDELEPSSGGLVYAE